MYHNPYPLPANMHVSHYYNKPADKDAKPHKVLVYYIGDERAEGDYTSCADHAASYVAKLEGRR